jgi:hypothetical protein
VRTRWTFLSSIGLPSADVVIGWKDIVDELRYMNTVVELAADCHTMGVPIDIFDNCRSPEIALLDVL